MTHDIKIEQQVYRPCACGKVDGPSSVVFAFLPSLEPAEVCRDHSNWPELLEGYGPRMQIAGQATLARPPNPAHDARLTNLQMQGCWVPKTPHQEFITRQCHHELCLRVVAFVTEPCNPDHDAPIKWTIWIGKQPEPCHSGCNAQNPPSLASLALYTAHLASGSVP
jgi:hypothetical protein